MLELARRKDWKGFIFSLGLWYVFVLFISLTNTALVPFDNWLLFYTKYSWPNFLLVYALAIWIIPHALHRKKYLRLILLSAFALIVYLFMRYLNNTFWDAYYYSRIDQNNNPLRFSWSQIVGMELLKGFQFTIIGFSYRFALDSLQIEKEKNELEKTKLKAELSALRYQLNPHFLFNAINNIYFLTISESKKTPEALIKLSEILRYLLDTQDEWIPVQNELLHIQRIIAFQLIRFPEEKIILHKTISPGNELVPIPPLILTTFIENAFKHGKQGTSEKPVEVSLEITDEKILYQVKNPIDINKSTDLSRKGIGLETLGRRLCLLYPDKHVFSYGKQEDFFIAFLELHR